MKNSSYYIAPVGVRTHDLPHTAATNMGKVSYALTHSATARQNGINIYYIVLDKYYCSFHADIVEKHFCGSF